MKHIFLLKTPGNPYLVGMLNLSFQPFPDLQTSRLSLRRISYEDTRALYFLRSDPTVLRYLDRDPVQNQDEVSLFIAQIHQLENRRQGINWAICLREEEEMKGTICLWNIRADHHRAELGYILHPDLHGKGLMQEAAEAVITYGFKTMQLHSIEAHVNPGNEASRKLLLRNGFVSEAYYRQNYRWGERFLDTEVFSLLCPQARENNQVVESKAVKSP